MLNWITANWEWVTGGATIVGAIAAIIALARNRAKRTLLTSEGRANTGRQQRNQYDKELLRRVIEHLEPNFMNNFWTSIHYYAICLRYNERIESYLCWALQVQHRFFDQRLGRKYDEMSKWLKVVRGILEAAEVWLLPLLDDKFNPDVLQSLYDMNVRLPDANKVLAIVQKHFGPASSESETVGKAVQADDATEATAFRVVRAEARKSYDEFLNISRQIFPKVLSSAERKATSFVTPAFIPYIGSVVRIRTKNDDADTGSS